MMAVLALSAAGLSPPRLPARTSRSERRSALRRLRGGATADPIDEKLYSRQLYVMGRAAQLSLGSASVLLLGLTGLGAEVSKNLALAGVAQLDVHDAEEASLADLSSSWLLKPEDVGTARHAQAVDRLAPLNEHVRVRALGGDGRPLAEGDGQAACRLAGADGGEWWEREGAIDGYTVVVACDMPHAPLARLSAAARASGAKLVACWSAGLAGASALLAAPAPLPRGAACHKVCGVDRRRLRGLRRGLCGERSDRRASPPGAPRARLLRRGGRRHDGARAAAWSAGRQNLEAEGACSCTRTSAREDTDSAVLALCSAALRCIHCLSVARTHALP